MEDLFTYIMTHPRELLIGFGICAAGALAGAVALLVVASKQIADIEIPEGADFFETLQHLPITVPLALDLLDMAFDVFAAPISWVILELLGLQALQMITLFEGLIPGTQLIPTMTIAWVIARMMKKKPKSELQRSLHEYQLEQRIQARRRQLQSYRRDALPAPDLSTPRSSSSSDQDVVEGEYFEEDMDHVPLDDDEEPW